MKEVHAYDYYCYTSDKEYIKNPTRNQFILALLFYIGHSIATNLIDVNDLLAQL